MPRQRKRRPVVNVLERILRHLPDGLTDKDCWVTTYKAPKNKYALIQLDGGYKYGDRMMRRLHRVAWEAHNAEPIPEGMVVMHSCDNPACINPNHLSLGTPKDNTMDMIAKGRDGCLKNLDGKRQK